MEKANSSTIDELPLTQYFIPDCTYYLGLATSGRKVILGWTSQISSAIVCSLLPTVLPYSRLARALACNLCDADPLGKYMDYSERGKIQNLTTQDQETVASLALTIKTTPFNFSITGHPRLRFQSVPENGIVNQIVVSQVSISH